MAESTIKNPNAVTIGTETITYKANVTTDSDPRFKVELKKVGRMVFFTASLQINAAPYLSSTYIDLCTLPVGFRPSIRIMFPANAGTSVWGIQSLAKVQIDDTGNVSGYASDGSKNCNHIQFNCSFVVDS